MRSTTVGLLLVRPASPRHRVPTAAARGRPGSSSWTRRVGPVQGQKDGRSTSRESSHGASPPGTTSTSISSSLRRDLLERSRLPRQVPDRSSPGTPSNTVVTVDAELDIWFTDFKAVYNLLEPTITPYAEIGMRLDRHRFEHPGLEPADTGCWWDPWWGYTCASFDDTYENTITRWSYGVGVRWDLSDTSVLKALVRGARHTTSIEPSTWSRKCTPSSSPGSSSQAPRMRAWLIGAVVCAASAATPARAQRAD